MSSIKLLSDMVASRNLTLKEETPDRIVFELWDKANWDKIARGINRDMFSSDLTTFILWLGVGIVLLFIIPRPWGMIIFLASLVLLILFAIYRMRLYQKAKLTSPPCAIFDRNTGLVTGINIDFSTFESKPWQAEIQQIDILSLKWDDPRFDMAMLEALDSSGLLLCAFFGRSGNLRRSADILKAWLRVNLQDDIKN